MGKRLSFGLIGCGDFGQQLGRYILEVADITALCDVNIAGASKTATALSIDAPVFGDFREMLDAGGLDAVAITAANFAHAEITVAAAEAGLHVFCEKIMAPTVAECRGMIEACERNGVKLVVGHKRRLRPSWARMIELARADGELGEPLAITIAQYADMRPYRYPGTWWADAQRSGGPLALLCPHVLDWASAMCGRAVSVAAHYGSQMNTGYGYPDILHGTWRFDSGALATVNSSFEYPLHKYRQSQGPMVQCRRGAIKCVPDMDTIDLYWQRLDETEAHHERFAVADDFPPAYRREIGDFVRWVTNDQPPCLTWREGLHCVEMMEAAYQSARLDGSTVQILDSVAR